MPRDSMEGIKAHLPLPGDVKIDVVSLLVLHGGGSRCYVGREDEGDEIAEAVESKERKGSSHLGFWFLYRGALPLRADRNVYPARFRAATNFYFYFFLIDFYSF